MKCRTSANELFDRTDNLSLPEARVLLLPSDLPLVPASRQGFQARSVPWLDGIDPRAVNDHYVPQAQRPLQDA
ncbi:hypothetical protein D3C76_1627660 [compost metagenome]